MAFVVLQEPLACVSDDDDWGASTACRLHVVRLEFCFAKNIKYCARASRAIPLSEPRFSYSEQSTKMAQDSRRLETWQLFGHLGKGHGVLSLGGRGRGNGNRISSSRGKLRSGMGALAIGGIPSSGRAREEQGWFSLYHGFLVEGWKQDLLPVGSSTRNPSETDCFLCWRNGSTNSLLWFTIDYSDNF